MAILLGVYIGMGSGGAAANLKKKTPELGFRIDIMLTFVQIRFFFQDHELITIIPTQKSAYQN